MSAKLRIESSDDVVHNARVVYVGKDGAETDISDCVQTIDVHLHVGEVSRATLHTILIEGRVDVAKAEAITKWLKPKSRIARWHWRAKDRIKTRIARSLSQEVRRELARHAARSGSGRGIL